MLKEVLLPDLGEGIDSADVSEILINPGDSVSIDDIILVLESDKASMEITAEDAGVVKEVFVNAGDEVKTGAPLISIEVSSGSTEESKPEPKEEEPKKEDTETKIETKASEVKSENISSDKTFASPGVRRLARELDIDLTTVNATGPKGRITKNDLHGFIKQKMAQGGSVGTLSLPKIDFSQWGSIDEQPLTKIQKITGDRLQQAWQTVPHVTQFDNADITDLEEFRGKHKNSALEKGIKLTPVAFVIKAVAIALQENPEFNRSPLNDRDNYVQKEYVNIGMAVDTEKGLFVPVIKSADKMGVWEIAKNVLDMADKARNGALTPNEMQGGCFTVSSLGAIGGNGFTPIVNSPEIGILGVSKAQIKPVWIDSEFVPRLMLPLSLSYDHRLINGGNAGKFLTSVVRLLSDVRTMIL